ncbi:MAG: hypothetical protein LBC21_02280 [Oscillospiraceae bacterium]|nr:hypothetical protein [Oscillospiraceae bacterium]
MYKHAISTIIPIRPVNLEPTVPGADDSGAE